MKKQTSVKTNKIEHEYYPVEQFVTMIKEIKIISDKYISNITDCKLKKRAEENRTQDTFINSIDIEKQKGNSKFNLETPDRREYEMIFTMVEDRHLALKTFTETVNKKYVKKMPQKARTSYLYSAFRLLTNNATSTNGPIITNMVEKKPKKGTSIVMSFELTTEIQIMIRKAFETQNVTQNYYDVFHSCVEGNLKKLNNLILDTIEPIRMESGLDWPVNEDDKEFFIRCLALDSNIGDRIKLFFMAKNLAIKALNGPVSNRDNLDAIDLACTLYELGARIAEINFLPHDAPAMKGYYPTSGRKPRKDKALRFGKLYVDKCIELMKIKQSSIAEPEAKKYISSLHEKEFGKGLSDRQIQRYQKYYYDVIEGKLPKDH